MWTMSTVPVDRYTCGIEGIVLYLKYTALSLKFSHKLLNNLFIRYSPKSDVSLEIYLLLLCYFQIKCDLPYLVTYDVDTETAG